MTAITTPSAREQAVARELRRRAIEAIHEMSEKDAAELLSLAPTGVKALLWREQWSIETAFRVVDALNLPELEAWARDLTSPSRPL